MKNYWEQDNVKLGFEYSKSIISHYAKSFYFSSQFLPEERKWGAYAVYAFCRYADNIIDNPRERTSGEILEELENFRNEINLAYKYGESEHPALSAFIYTAKKFNIPVKYSLELLDGVSMDMNITRYNNFEELYTFAYKVASTVGIMMAYVIGFEKEEAIVYAEKLGVAMQLTNILRDIKEDKDLGRIYLPQDEMQKFNVKENDIIEENFTPELRELIVYNVQRARRYYNEANPGIMLLNRESRFSIATAARIYGRILNKIETNNFNPFLGRVYISFTEKISAMGSELIKSKFKRV